MKTYMLLFWAPKQLVAAPRSPEDARKSGEKWSSWEQALRSAGRSVTGAQLESGGQCVTGSVRKVAEGAFPGDQVMGGYYLVSASSPADAMEVAKGCPVLDSGGTVEVRPVMEHE